MDEPRSGKGRLKPVVGVVLAAGLGFLLCQQLLLTVFVVHGVSMEPTLRPGQRVLVFRATSDLARGDLVVFRNPTNPQEVLLKRVLAVPGEAIEAKGGHLYVLASEGVRVELAEPYVKPGTTVGSFPAARLEPDEFYMLGDNRGESVDSRTFGEIDRRLILGKVVYTLW